MLAAARRPLGNANPFLSEGAIDGACRVGGQAQAGSGAWRAADRPNERTKGQGETGVNSNEPNLADVEEESGEGEGGLELQNRRSCRESP